MTYYYLAIDGKPAGPYPAEQVAQMVKEGQITGSTLGFTQGMVNWTAIDMIPELHKHLAPAAAENPPVVPATAMAGAGAAATPRMCHDVDYEIFGDDMQFVEITLDPNETVLAEAGAFMFMTQGVQMQTQFGDGSTQNQGFLAKAMEAGRRVVTGESLFITTFSARGAGKEKVSFAAPYPGKIVPLDLGQLGGTMICQKQAFLCAALGTNIGIEFTRKIGTGLFGGEGFILQRLTGDGMAFVHAGGTIVERQLNPGEHLKVDTGCIVAFQPSVSYDIQFIGGIRNSLFGGEGLFFATLTGPGRVWLQSLPFSRLADRIFASAPSAGGKRVGEGSILGGLGGLIDGS